MPSTSKKQHNLMAAVAHSPSFAKKVGIKQSVGKHFMEADKGKKFAGGGKAMAKMKHEDIVEDKKLIKKAVGMHDKQMHGGKKTNLSTLKKGGMTFGGKETKAEEARERKMAPSKAAYKKAEIKYEGEAMKRGGCVKKMAAGGKAKGTDVKIAMLKKAMSPSRAETDMTTAPAPQRQQAAAPAAPRMMAPGVPMKKGGCVKKMASGGLAAGHKSADGIATKGKTRGKEVTMARGGKAKRYC